MDCTKIFKDVREAGRKLSFIDSNKLERILLDVACELEACYNTILSANLEDLARMEVSDPKYDRLKLTEGIIKGMAADVRCVALMPSPAGKIISRFIRPDGLSIRRVTVPFGVIGVIYEARPNVTLDVSALCLKSGNACILKGGWERCH